jgi:hypothetical protein
MTGVGVTLYLVLGMHNYLLAALAAGLFAPLIVFHLSLAFFLGKKASLALKGFENK